MAEQVTLGTFATLQNSSIIATLNANNVLIETAFADCLSLSGTLPNQILSNLDMNNNQIINLPAPSTLNSPVRLIDLQNATIGSFGSGIYGLLAGTNSWTGVNTFTNTTQSTSTITGAVILNGGLGIAKNLNVGGTFSVGTVVGTGVTTITINNLGGTFPTAGSDGIVLQNTTAATNGTPVQISPDIRFTGYGWNTTTSTSQEVDWIISTVPGSGSAVYGELALGCQINGTGYKYIANFYSGATNTQLFLGNNSNQSVVVIAGSSSGASGGGLITVQNGLSNNKFLLGNKSAAFGGTYDATPILYALPVSGSTSFEIFVNSVSSTSAQIYASGTASTSTTSGTLVVTGGLGVSTNSYFGGLVVLAAGTTAAPSLVATNSTTTGLSFPAAGQFALSSAASTIIDYGVTFASILTVSSSGGLLVNTSGIYGPTSGYIGFLSRSLLFAPADSQIKVTNSAQTSSFTLAATGSAAPIKFVDAGSFSANGSVATTVTSLGPTGSHTTIQTWLTIVDSGGTTRYIPCY